MTLTVEYLAVIEEATSHTLYHMCDSVEQFRQLLQKSDGSIQIKGESLVFDGSDRFTTKITMGEVKGKRQRHFHVTVKSIENSDKSVERIVACNRALKKAMEKNGLHPETLWTDVSLHYGTLAYPHIHRMENLMRKLITCTTNLLSQQVPETD